MGIVEGEAMRVDLAELVVDGEARRFLDLPLAGTYTRAPVGGSEDDDTAEWILPVRWLRVSPRTAAYWEAGMFANQNSACKLRQQFTLDKLAQHFDLEEDAEG